MPLLTRVSALWRNLAARDRVERDLDDEVRTVFELLVDEKTRSGMDLLNARRTMLINGVQRTLALAVPQHEPVRGVVGL